MTTHRSHILFAFGLLELVAGAAAAQSLNEDAVAPRERIDAAVRLIQQQEYEEAVEMLDELIDAREFEDFEDSVRSDAAYHRAAAQLYSGDSGKAYSYFEDQTALDPAVGRNWLGRAIGAMYQGDYDDLPSAFTGDKVGADEVGVDYPTYPVVGHISGATAGSDASIGDHGIDGAEARFRRIIGCDDRSFVSHVHRHGKRMSAIRLNFLGKFGGPIQSPRAKNDTRTGRGKEPGEPGSYPRRGACDQGNPTIL